MSTAPSTIFMVTLSRPLKNNADKRSTKKVLREANGDIVTTVPKSSAAKKHHWAHTCIIPERQKISQAFLLVEIDLCVFLFVSVRQGTKAKAPTFWTITPTMGSGMTFSPFFLSTYEMP